MEFLSDYSFSVSLDIYFRALVNYYHYETLLFSEMLLLLDGVPRMTVPPTGHDNPVDMEHWHK